MNLAQLVEVDVDDSDVRLDRWFRRRYPELNHGHLEKMLRKGQVRVDGARVKAGHRLAPGQLVRVPPLVLSTPKPRAKVSDHDSRELRKRILYRDPSVLVLDKPAGLAVQGGSGTKLHLDGMLDALQFDASERPRLVHRLDRDTSGVLVLARHTRAVASLAQSFRDREAKKLYWAITSGVPPHERGQIDLPLAKLPGRGGERARVHRERGKRSTTDFAVIEQLGKQAAWLALWPQTGRTHQLRAHCAAIGTPILGDGKYGAAASMLSGLAVSKGLHLHARSIKIPHPDAGTLTAEARVPEHFHATMQALGFNPEAAAERMAEIQAEDNFG